jgi:hypothetical protein
MSVNDSLTLSFFVPKPMNESNSPPLSTVNIQLHTKLQEVLVAPLQSAERAKAMSRFIQQLQHLPGIKKVAHQDYYLALNQTWEWISRNIDEFRSSTDFLADDLVRWINGHLYWRIYDLYHPAAAAQQHLSLDEQVFQEGETYLNLLSNQGFLNIHLNTLDQQIQYLQQEEHRRIALQIEKWIAADPDQLLYDCHPKGQHQCNCQTLSYSLIIKDPPDSFTNLAKDLNISYQTLVSHWKRKCLPLLQAHTKNCGYEP